MRFDYAISFAGAQRDIARELCRLLEAAGLRIFFQESAGCVTLISKEYGKSAWTDLERRAVQARELQHGLGLLIPVLVDEHRPEWLLPTRIYFDFQKRGLTNLAQVLVRRVTGEGHLFTEEFRADDFVEFPIELSSTTRKDEFFAWCAHHESSNEVMQIVRTEHAWTKHPTPFRFRCDKVLVSDKWIIKVGHPWDAKIHIYSIDGTLQHTCWPPRESEWNSVTSCCLWDGNLFLGFCGGDVWVYNITARRFSQLKEGVSDPRYAYLAVGGEIIIYGADEEQELTIFSTQTFKAKGTIKLAHPIGDMVLFPQLSRLVVDAYDAIILYDTRDWTIVNKIELSEPLGYSLTSDPDSSLFAFLNGNAMYANTLYACEGSTGQVVTRQVSPRARPYRSIAIVRGGGAIVTSQGNAIIVFHRRKPE